MDSADEELDPFELESIERRADASDPADVRRLVRECRQLRRALAEARRAAQVAPRSAGSQAAGSQAAGSQAAGSQTTGRAEAAELELERAHRLLDELAIPRSERPPGERDPVEYSLLARLRIALGHDA